METLAPLLESGTVDVFAKMLGWKIEPKPGFADFEMPMRMFGVTGSVSLAGKLSGVVYLNLSDSTGEKAAEQILGEMPPVPASEVNDVVGELTNMISGNIKSKMSDRGYPCRLSIPTVMRGTPVIIDTQAVPVKLGADFLLPNSSEIISVHLFARLDPETL